MLWVNALGLGGNLSFMVFLEELAMKSYNHTILFTSTTLQSQVALDEILLINNTIHQFLDC